MSGTYLPGDTRQRIQDLIKNRKVTQAELADKIGISESALSRYLQGKTEMLGDGYTVTNFGVSSMTFAGEKIKGGDNNFSYWKTDKFKAALASSPNIVVIELGTNANTRCRQVRVAPHCSLIRTTWNGPSWTRPS